MSTSIKPQHFHQYTQKGYSLRALAYHLTTQQVVPGRVWNPSSLFEILHNSAYTGVTFYGKRQRQESPGNPDKKTAWKHRPQAEWISIPVPPLIDEQTFQQAQALLQRNGQQSRRNRKYEYLLCNQRLRCGRCGRVMSGEYNSRRDWRFYRCSRRRAFVGTPCKSRVGAQPLEDLVWRSVVQALDNPDIIAVELQRRQQGSETQQSELTRERQAYERQLAQCEKDLGKWEQAFLAHILTVEDFKAKKGEVDMRRQGAQHAIARLDEQQRLIEHATLQIATIADYCTRIRQRLNQFTLQEKQLALAALDITATWRKDQPLEIRGGIPVGIVSGSIR